ncbi:MAG: precorrin-2 C(20)-methyltransferase [Flavobacteriaceae bacterium]|nr:precorrin-2 C(20)-methyltransferase [Flavobacteriaceae bacterium]
MLHKIYGVALGPGDPELLTIKALNVLKEVDVIFYPGSNFNGKQKSYVYAMLEYHNLISKRLEGFFLEMSLDRTAAEQVYNDTVKKIKAEYESGLKVAIVCEGDLSLYASFSYVLNRLKALELPVDLVPGVNAFSLGAAKHQIPISLLNDKVAIIPREKSISKLEAYFQDFDTLILMKIRSSWIAIYKLLEAKQWSFYYCERLGTNQEYISTDLQDISKREIPYFSLLIIKKTPKDD